MSDNYDDIINIEHFEPKHPRMSRYNRAAQFAPFAALTGYDDEIKETARRTEKKQSVDEQCARILNEQINYLNNHIKEHQIVHITYFVKDEKKAGGKYITDIGQVKSIDLVNKFIKLNNNMIIKFTNIINIVIEDKNKSTL